MARAKSRSAIPFRVGLGWDAHALVSGRPLMLGGVRVPSARGLLGHSDGDVLCHAIADAVLGAAGEGDLGTLLPATRASTRGLSGRQVLAAVARKISGRRVLSLDAVIMCETPTLARHISAMRRNVARALAMDSRCVSIKPKRAEGLGAIGRNEGIAAQAVALLWDPHE